jgi:hypothetical protein
MKLPYNAGEVDVQDVVGRMKAAEGR